MKILYVTTISLTMGFFSEHIRMLQNEGHVVELACNLNSPLPEKIAHLNCKAYHIPFSRSPFSRDNILAYKKLKKLLAKHDYDIVHTHTPNASVIVRLACRKMRKTGLKVFYTAHGFHFYKGAPLKNWLLYFPVEWLLSYVTDVLIAINTEDYGWAQKFGAKKVCYVPGVGIDLSKFDFEFSKEDRRAKRVEIGVPEEVKLLISVGELNRNKNHEVIVRALAKLNNPDVHYCIAGRGELGEYLLSLAKELGVAERVHLLGYRNDVAQLYKASDICCFPSFREGLPVSVLEAIASGLPVVAADNRGTRDIINHERNGVLCQPTNVDSFAKAIKNALKSASAIENMKRAEIQNFSKENVLAEMRKIYQL